MCLFGFGEETKFAAREQRATFCVDDSFAVLLATAYIGQTICGERVSNSQDAQQLHRASCCS